MQYLRNLQYLASICQVHALFSRVIRRFDLRTGSPNILLKHREISVPVIRRFL